MCNKIVKRLELERWKKLQQPQNRKADKREK